MKYSNVSEIGCLVKQGLDFWFGSEGDKQNKKSQCEIGRFQREQTLYLNLKILFLIAICIAPNQRPERSNRLYQSSLADAVKELLQVLPPGVKSVCPGLGFRKQFENLFAGIFVQD